MAINIDITYTKKWVYFLVIIGMFLVLIVGVIAFNPDMSVGDPTVMGHSAGEIMVNYTYYDSDYGGIISENLKYDNKNRLDYQSLIFTINGYDGSISIFNQCFDLIVSNTPPGYDKCLLRNYDITNFNNQIVDCNITCFK